MSDLCKEVANMGKGIGNENRYRILEALMLGSLTVGEITKKVKIPQPAVSQHLKILKSIHFVEDKRQGKVVLYSVNVPYMAGLLKKLAKDLPNQNKK